MQNKVVIYKVYLMVVFGVIEVCRINFWDNLGNSVEIDQSSRQKITPHNLKSNFSQFFNLRLKVVILC
jgi:hypothetical protein